MTNMEIETQMIMQAHRKEVRKLWRILLSNYASDDVRYTTPELVAQFVKGIETARQLRDLAIINLPAEDLHGSR